MIHGDNRDVSINNNKKESHLLFFNVIFRNWSRYLIYKKIIIRRGTAKINYYSILDINISYYKITEM